MSRRRVPSRFPWCESVGRFRAVRIEDATSIADTAASRLMVVEMEADSWVG